MLCRLALTISLVLGTASGVCLFGADLKPQSRMAIMRGLIAEYATAKSPLPRGEKGLFLKADGEIDDERLHLQPVARQQKLLRLPRRQLAHPGHVYAEFLLSPKRFPAEFQQYPVENGFAARLPEPWAAGHGQGVAPTMSDVVGTLILLARLRRVAPLRVAFAIPRPAAGMAAPPWRGLATRMSLLQPGAGGPRYPFW